MKSKRNLIYVIVMALIFAAIFAGCTTARKPMYTPVKNSADITGNKGALNPGVYNYDPNAMNNYNLNKSNYTTPLSKPNIGMGTPVTQSDKVAKAVQTVPGVKTAHVVLSGTTAYVGLGLQTAASTDVTRLKKAVAAKVKLTDASISTVYVSTNAAFYQRLTKIGNSIKNGTPVEGFVNELTQMVKGIVPQKG